MIDSACIGDDRRRKVYVISDFETSAFGGLFARVSYDRYYKKAGVFDVQNGRI